MPRYKEYNKNRVTEKAMYRFWLSGFGATSLDELTQEMKINKFSFYEAFESKDRLLIETMEYYYKKFLGPKLDQLRESKSIFHFLLSFLRADEKGFHGCFILNITSETGKTIPGAVEILNEYISEILGIIKEIVTYYHPGSTTENLDIKIQQLLGLCTSIPMIYPIKSASECKEYIHIVLSRLDMNQSANYAT